jgi:acetyl/propionyl-CoA carboxylase alpha subunit/acetyl-CoA carboxylase carboxyltransferase component
MPIARLLIANRGEIAIRIVRTAAEMGIATIAVHPEDDAGSLHVELAGEAWPLPGVGVAAYLDIARIIEAAREAKADAIHPGYGFLSENAAFARACAEAGIVFVGPSPETLEVFGDKVQARLLADRSGVPVIPGTSGATSLEEARAFLSSLGPSGAVMVKAVAGGGGRGMRPVRSAPELDGAYELCRSEAAAAFGNGDLYVERLFADARHIEVQVVGDGRGGVSHVWERECSLQRQRQKIIEIAPAPGLPGPVRARLLESAVKLAKAARLKSLATIEFLVDANPSGDGAFAFIEANPRLQVEHTVTEEVTGLDLVRAQLEIAAGAKLADIGLAQKHIPAPRGIALQARVNMETMTADGGARPAGGTLTVFEPPGGPGVRVDTFGYAGYRTSPRYDSLLAKVIVHARSGRLEDVAGKAERALAQFRVSGVPTNIGFLRAVLGHEAVKGGRGTTRFIEDKAADLVAAATALRTTSGAGATPGARLAGAKVDTIDPLAVLDHARTAGEGGGPQAPFAAAPSAAPAMEGPEGTVAVVAPMQGTIVSLAVAEGDEVRGGQDVLVMEAMKMQHVIAAKTGGTVRLVTIEPGDTVYEGHALLYIEEGEVGGGTAAEARDIDLDHIRPDLREVLDRQALTQDEARPDAVARRRKTGQRTARENIADLVDPGSFTEYGSLTIAARRGRVPLDELIARTPADGLVTGIARINGSQFEDARSRAAVMAYDYTVLAGTQGKKNHDKMDRFIDIIRRMQLPLVMFSEGGGGRPGDVDVNYAASLHIRTFHDLPRLSGLVPMVGINSGYCFAGNAVVLGVCDVVIATRNSSIGMGGPAMIEGGGLGVFRPQEVGPMSVQVPNGVVDIAVEDEAEAVAVAKKYLSYFQGPVADWGAADQRRLRSLVPEDRLRAYDVRKVIGTLVDTGSLLELRTRFGVGIITALARIEGRPIGLLANNPMHLGGAIDADAADKAARFMQLCDAFDLPVVFLCDTPGNMVGPEAERDALVRHCCRLYVVGANMTVPFFTVVLRKGYGLGAQGMAAGSFHAPIFTISWPTGEFGGMGLEGAVKLGYRNELAAITDTAERKALFEAKVAELYERGKALSVATYFELDDVIDPADTRRWIMAGLRAAPPPAPRTGKKHAWIDTW